MIPAPPADSAWRNRLPWLIGGVLAIVLQVVDWTPLARLDLAVFDIVSPTLAPESAADADAVVIAIDDTSIAELGAWPWPRGTHAALLDRLSEVGVRAIGYDVLFPEAADDPAEDTALAHAILRNGRVALPVAPSVVAASAAGLGLTTLGPLPALARAARSLGHVDVEIDADRVARRLFLEAGIGDARWAALPLAVRTIRDERSSGALPGRRGPDGSSTPSGTWGRNHEVLMPRASAPVPELPFSHILRDPALASTLAGKTVFVGATATGLGTALVTSIGESRAATPAVRFMAWAYVALDAGRAIAPLDDGPALAMTGLIFLLLLMRGPPVTTWSSILVGVAIGLPLLLSTFLLNRYALWFAPMAATSGLVVGNLLWRAGRIREATRQLFQVQRHERATLHAIADGVVTVDAAGLVVYANPVARRLAGDPLTGRRASDLFGDVAPGRMLVEQALEDCRGRGGPVRVEVPLTLIRGDGEQSLVQLTATPLVDARGRAGGAVLALQDVTETAATRARLDHAATHDALTGLPNRAAFVERLREALSAPDLATAPVAVLFMDLDRFKRINDSLGHRCGDQVLVEIGSRLRRGDATVDIVARWGGDEFVALLRGLPDRAAIADATRRLMALVNRTLDIDGLQLHCSCSVGIAVAPDDAVDADALLTMADVAMYRGRARSGGDFGFFSPDMNLRSRDRLARETSLRHALVRRELEIHYQPQVELATGRTVALEALLRWRRPDGTLVMPDAFIPIAEESGLIQAIGEWVLLGVCDQLAAWMRAGHPIVPVAVNVSARQCLDHGLARTLRDALHASGIAPGLLMLEITETTAMRDVEHVIDLLGDVHALGVGVAVDDFGTGYSSLAYLKRFPIDQLKIDQSFVRDVTTDDNDAAIVTAILALAHSLGWSVVAEGVETEAQRAFLAERRCDLAQGFLFCRPLPPEELASAMGWLSDVPEPDPVRN